VNLVTKPGD